MEVLDQPQTTKSAGATPSLASFVAPTASGSSWWTQLQQDAWKQYQSMPFPARNDEHFRFTDRSKFQFENLSHRSALSDKAKKQILQTSVDDRLKKQVGGRFVFGNDQLLFRQDLAKELAAQGVIWKPFLEAVEQHPELIQKHFMKEVTTLGSEKFARLHQAYVQAGTFIYIPKNVEVNLPLEAFHWIGDDKEMVFPHTLIVAEANSKVEIIDFFQSVDSENGGFCAAVCDLHAGPGAQVRYVATQLWGRQTRSFQLQSILVDKDAHSKTLNLNMGGAYSRLESKSRMIGSGSRSDMLSLTVANDKQEFDQRTFQEHVAQSTNSDLLFKNALADESRTIFSGMIEVDLGAQKTDAYQSNRNLLLSDTADANSMPGLEINANDVRCTHGSTTSQIDDAEMFYMRSRGVPLSIARKLFTLGFFQEVLERINDKELETELLDLIDKKYSQTKSL
ncbi:MAG: Fe-S cluster assembly protein SufD [Verrucomicrobiota bacterium]